MLTSKNLALLACLVLIGCGIPELEPLSNRNFSNTVEITKENVTFYNAKYTGTLKDVFPPPGKPYDPNPLGKTIYEPTKELAMNLYTFQASDRNVSHNQIAKEIMHAVIAKATIQEGFSKFILVSTSDYFGSSEYYTANTYGSVIGNEYVGSTSVNKNIVGAGLHVYSVIMFNDVDDINNGVFEKSIIKILLPYRLLYRWATPLDKDDLNEDKIFNASDGRRMSRRQITSNAWKSYYDPNTVYKELSEKHSIAIDDILRIKDSGIRAKQREEERKNDPLRRLKIPTEAAPK